MQHLIPIVEGPGDKSALPPLLVKILHRLGIYDIQIAPPIITKGRGNITTPGGIERFIEAAMYDPICSAVLVLIDLDDDPCAYNLAIELTARIRANGVKRPVVVVVASCEFENWFVASIDSIRGKDLNGLPGIKEDASAPLDPELVNGAGFLKYHFSDGRIYKKTLDQEPMARLIDCDLALERSRSFRRLYHAIEEIVSAMRANETIITPLPPVSAPRAAERKKRGR